MVIIAMPSFGGRAPVVAIERLRKIHGNGAKCVLVCVYGNRAYEDTLAEMEDAAKECGFQVTAAISAVAEHSIMPQYAAGRPDETDRKQLIDFADKITGKTGSVSTNPGNRPYKKAAMINMFDKSMVALIYGAAGTGKTTLINYISTFFKDYSRLYLTHTNPAINNLKRKVSASSNCTFMTITKFNNKYAKNIKRDYDIPIIDECSTVSNKSMRELLELAQYKLLILVGDIYQIEAIEFGNGFNAVRFFIPKTSVCELKNPFRTESWHLLNLWDNVRNMHGNNDDSDVFDRLQAGEFSAELDTSIFNPAAENEIILCLNYGGLYGINNINHFMQENNNGKEIRRGIQRYKVGDPILFNDSADSFFSSDEDEVPVIHNNMKAKIVDFLVLNEGQANESIQFDVELDKPLIGLNMENRIFKIIGTTQEGNSIIRFEVFKNKSTDNDDGNFKAMVPFQISYAVSIHKAQGLEYDSVKIVITDEVDELITHSIFYTAITRAKKRLKIYWSKTAEQKILERIKPIDNHQDIALLKSEIG